MVSEIHKEQSINEENSSLFMKRICRKAKTKSEHLKIMLRNLKKLYFHEFHLKLRQTFPMDKNSDPSFVDLDFSICGSI
jgi:hypothetical protein